MRHRVEVYVSPVGQDWMTSCTREADVLIEVLNALIVRLQRVQALGELYGADNDRPIRKLEGFERLWESRVRHRTGWYRQFFRFVTVDGHPSAAFVDGAVKKGRSLPRHVLEAADRRLDAYVADLLDHPAIRTRDHVK